MYLTDEELCMLEQLTYLDEDVAKAAGINSRFSKINEGLKNRTPYFRNEFILIPLFVTYCG